MYYGHGWIAVVIIAGLFAMRALSSQRRRGGRTSQNPFVNGNRPHRPVGPPPAPYGQGQPATAYRPDGRSTGVAPGWFVDPFGRHTQRYWSGTEWTEHVTDDGVPGVDAPPRRPTSPDAG